MEEVFPGQAAMTKAVIRAAIRRLPTAEKREQAAALPQEKQLILAYYLQLSRTGLKIGLCKTPFKNGAPFICCPCPRCFNGYSDLLLRAGPRTTNNTVKDLLRGYYGVDITAKGSVQAAMLIEVKMGLLREEEDQMDHACRDEVVGLRGLMWKKLKRALTILKLS
ncbi:hypothetical protein Dimus_012866 [Dionaea muscipula]